MSDVGDYCQEPKTCRGFNRCRYSGGPIGDCDKPLSEGGLGPEKKSKEVSTFVDKAMYVSEKMDVMVPQVTLLSATPDPLGALTAFSMIYEGRVVRDLNEITDEERKRYFDDSFNTTLKAPWEAIDLHFMIEGVTRSFTHQMVRQRTAVFAQESLRFAVKEEPAARPGPMISQDRHRLELWQASVRAVWKAYQILIANGIPAEEARGLLPHDTLTRLHFKTNLRNLADHLGTRLCTQAQFEWKMVANAMRKAIANYSWGFTAEKLEDGRTQFLPAEWQFEHIANSKIFQPICFTTGQCMFKAEADRGCTIRERVDAGQFDQVRDEEWMLDPKAGWVS